MVYLLDANVFITARNLHYGFDFCPAFWDWLDLAHQHGRVFSIQRVADELTDEELAQWVALQSDTFFFPADATTLPALRTVAEWAGPAHQKPPTEVRRMFGLARWARIG